MGQRPKAKHNFSARCLWFVPQHSLSLLVAQVRRSPYGYLKMVGWCKILRPSAGTGAMDGQTGRRHGQRFAILHAKEKNDIVLRCGPSPCLSRARLPSQTEAALPDVCSPTVRYGTYLSIAAFLRLPSLFSNPDFENLWLMHYPDENLYL